MGLYSVFWTLRVMDFDSKNLIVQTIKLESMPISSSGAGATVTLPGLVFASQYSYLFFGKVITMISQQTYDIIRIMGQ